MIKNCTNCKNCGYDSNLLGYCNSKMCIAYRKIVIDDNGCKCDCCGCFEPFDTNKIIFRFWRKEDGAVFEQVAIDKEDAIQMIQFIEHNFKWYNTPIKDIYTNITVTLNKYNKEQGEETFNLYSERSARYFGMDSLKGE